MLIHTTWVSSSWGMGSWLVVGRAVWGGARVWWSCGATAPCAGLARLGQPAAARCATGEEGGDRGLGGTWSQRGVVQTAASALYVKRKARRWGRRQRGLLPYGTGLLAACAAGCRAFVRVLLSHYYNAS